MGIRGEDPMLVVTANWAIADGTAYGGPPRGAVRAFFRELRRAAWRAGFRRDGLYHPLDTIQIVLAGDTFDGLTSLAWHGDVRPWQGGPRARAAAEQIAVAATRRGARLLAGLGRLRRSGLAVPQADSRGRPLPGTTCRAAVQVVCLVGDRDRVLDGPWFAALAGRHGIAIGSEWASDSLIIRHGSECDPLCGPIDLPPQATLPLQARCPTLAESLAVDLLVEFARRMQGTEVPRSTAAMITRLLAAASPLEMPLAIARHPHPVIQTAWQRSVRHWHTQAHATLPEAEVQHDAVDALAAWMETSIPRDPARLRHSDSPRHQLAAAIDSLRPRIPRRWPAAGLFVLGHPPASLTKPAPWHFAEAVGGYFLGPAPGSNLSMPPTVAFPEAETLRGVWLHEDRRDFTDSQRVHVAPCRVVGDEPGIVEAA
jgi:hypothetical protein